MIPKPLTKEESEEIDRLRVTMRGEGGMIGRMQQALEQACESEAFWREAVKNAKCERIGESESDQFYGDGHCIFCNAKYSIEMKPSDHKPDCAWLLAQDGE